MIEPFTLRACTFAVGAFILVCAAAIAAESPEGPTGQSQQPIVVGDDVSVAQQKELGLVTIGGGCSGTLLNRFWVLTANHCLNDKGKADSIPTPLDAMTITAAWTKHTVTPTRSVRYYLPASAGAASNSTDVALLFLGRGDFGPRKPALIYHNQVDTSMTLAKFGQGICKYAAGWGPKARPAEFNCGYRTARFTPKFADDTNIVIEPNESGQIANGGDSGGPDFVTGADGQVLSIAGVQSTCGDARYVRRKPRQWKWATHIGRCTSSALISVRDAINRVVQETPTIDQVSQIPGTSPGDFVREPDFGVVSDGGRGGDILKQKNTTCKSGYVWRVIRPKDLVCVTPASRALAARENTDGAAHIDPGGAYGPSTCVSGYVWRNAFEGDVVCVTPDAGARVAGENRNGPSLIAGTP